MAQLNVCDWEYLSLLLDQPAQDLERLAKPLVTTRHREMGARHQPLAFALVCSLPEPNPVVVETGVYSGCSTYFLLQALAKRGDEGVLHSVDPMYRSQGEAQSRISNLDLAPFWKGQLPILLRWCFHSGKSVKVLPELVETEAEWDVFVHDSDHSAANMRYELDFAWQHLRPGGFMFVDDPAGDETVGFHDETVKFLDEHELDYGWVKGAILVRKPQEMDV